MSYSSVLLACAAAVCVLAGGTGLPVALAHGVPALLETLDAPKALHQARGGATDADDTAWAGGIDRGGRIQCRIGEQGGNCSSPANCVHRNLTASALATRDAFCLHERMERPFLGKYVHSRARGVYTCACCNATLFHSHDQFDGGGAYLSFWAQSELTNVGYKHHEGSWWQHPHDTGLHCQHCGAHLGNVRRDGPYVTGRRYQVNSECVHLYCDTADCAPDEHQVRANEKIAKTWRAFERGDVFEVRYRRVMIASAILTAVSVCVVMCIWACGSRRLASAGGPRRRRPGEYP